MENNDNSLMLDEESEEIRARIEGIDGIVVICIGNKACGKTSIIQSLIAYMSDYSNGKIEIDTNNSRMMEFFNSARESFVHFRAKVVATANAFFAHMKYSPNPSDQFPAISLTFLDVRGEAYKSFVTEKGGMVKPSQLHPYIKAALSARRQVIWLFVGSRYNEMVNNIARESDVLGSFLMQLEQGRTDANLKNDKVILLVSKIDTLPSQDDVKNHPKVVYEKVIHLFENRHGELYGSLAYSTGTWNDEQIPTSLNEDHAYRLANYLYKLKYPHGLPPPKIQDKATRITRGLLRRIRAFLRLGVIIDRARRIFGIFP